MDELMLVLPEEMEENKRVSEFVQTLNKLLVIVYQKGFEAGKEGKSHE